MNKTIAVIALAASLPLLAQRTPQQIMQAAQADYEKKDFAAYLGEMQELASIRPAYPVVQFNLAGAYALNGKADEAAATLNRIAAMRIVMDVDAEHDFDGIRDTPQFQKARSGMQKAAEEKINHSTIAFTLPEKDLVTEGIAYDPKSKSFFVTSTHRKKILRIDAKGKSSLWYDGSKGTNGFQGVKIDAKRRRLWSCATASERVDGFQKENEGKTALYEFDLDSKKLLATYEPEGATEPQFFDDLLVTNDGTVYVMNAHGSIWRLAPGAKSVELFLKPGRMRSPQGAVESPDGKALYVSDYGNGVMTIDRTTAEVKRMEVPADFPAFGIDGLASDGTSLLAIQNGVNPNRLSRLYFDPTHTKIARWEILEMNHPQIDEPTLGVVVGHDLYWIGGSQGNKIDAKPPKLDELKESVIFKTPLDQR